LARRAEFLRRVSVEIVEEEETEEEEREREREKKEGSVTGFS